MFIILVEGITKPSDNQGLVRTSLVRRGTADPPVPDWPEGQEEVWQIIRANSGGFNS